jgi:hypothetical protein
MLKFFLGVALIVLSGCSGASRGLGIDFNLIPTQRLTVINSCYASTVLVMTPDGRETSIRYGNSAILNVRNFQGGHVEVTARGVGDDGLYVGSATKSVNLRSGTSYNDWHITTLRGGQRSCRPPRASRS